MSDSMDTGSTKARVNNLETSDFTINTPNCFLHTNYGLPPCITPDLLKDMPQPILLPVSVPQLYQLFLIFSYFIFLIFFNFWTNEVTTILKFSQNIFQVYSNILESKIKQREIGQAGNVI